MRQGRSVQSDLWGEILVRTQGNTKGPFVRKIVHIKDLLVIFLNMNIQKNIKQAQQTVMILIISKLIWVSP